MAGVLKWLVAMAKAEPHQASLKVLPYPAKPYGGTRHVGYTGVKGGRPRKNSGGRKMCKEAAVDSPNKAPQIWAEFATFPPRAARKGNP